MEDLSSKKGITISTLKHIFRAPDFEKMNQTELSKYWPTTTLPFSKLVEKLVAFQSTIILGPSTGTFPSELQLKTWSSFITTPLEILLSTVLNDSESSLCKKRDLCFAIQTLHFDILLKHFH